MLRIACYAARLDSFDPILSSALRDTLDDKKRHQKKVPKKQLLKGSSLSVRLPEKTRYGLELAARSSQMQLSSMVIRAIEDLLEKTGITKRIDGDVVTWLDRLWSESESQRLMLLGEHAPMLMTPAEKTEMTILKAIDSHSGDLLMLIADQGLLYDLLSPGVSDTFADDVLLKNKEYKTTAELKHAARELAEALHPA